jgi:hypothetical protein
MSDDGYSGRERQDRYTVRDGLHLGFGFMIGVALFWVVMALFLVVGLLLVHAI